MLNISLWLQYYVLPYEYFTKDFVKLVFKGKKKFLKLSEVKFVHVIKYEELSVKNLYDKFMTLQGVQDYFPDKYAKGRVIDREFMFNVVNTLHEEIVIEIIQYAH